MFPPSAKNVESSFRRSIADLEIAIDFRARLQLAKNRGASKLCARSWSTQRLRAAATPASDNGAIGAS
jgi:hypothetical protein